MTTLIPKFWNEMELEGRTACKYFACGAICIALSVPIAVALMVLLFT